MADIVKKFVLITENFPPCAGGGIAEWALGISENLSSMNHQVTVLSKWQKQTDINIHKDKLFRLKRMAGHDWRKFRYWYSLFYLWLFLRSNPECYIIATTWELGYCFVFLKKYFPLAKLVTIAHGREVTKLNKKKELKKFRKTIETSLLVFGVSRFTRNAILGKINGESKHKIVCLPNDVDTKRFYYDDDYNQILEYLEVPKGHKIIITLARIIERKGHDTVILCLPKVISQFPNTTYIIAGPRQERYYKKLIKLIEKLNLERNVIFTKFVNEDDLKKYYSQSDVYVMVSRTLPDGDSEGFGITFLEANACQCPVIGSYSGGIPDAVSDGISGYLVPPDDPDALAEKIIHIFSKPDLAEKLGEDGKKLIEEKFTWSKISSQLLFELDKMEGNHKTLSY